MSKLRNVEQIQKTQTRFLSLILNARGPLKPLLALHSTICVSLCVRVGRSRGEHPKSFPYLIAMAPPKDESNTGNEPVKQTPEGLSADEETSSAASIPEVCDFASI